MKITVTVFVKMMPLGRSYFSIFFLISYLTLEAVFLSYPRAQGPLSVFEGIPCQALSPQMTQIPWLVGE